MKQVKNFWLPDSEEHLVPFLESGPSFANGPTYQLHKFQACFPLIKNFRHAVDVGAHCGLWSRVFAQCFDRLVAFEPIAEHRECYARNVAEFDWPINPRLERFALSDKKEMLRFDVKSKSSGDTSVSSNGRLEVPARTIDSFEFEVIDFIKMDCEGYEYFVIKGGEETIRKYRPCIIVEQKPGRGSKYGLADDAAVDLLVSWGASVRNVISGDYILAW